MYKYDTHVHTSEVSRCSHSSAIEMVRASKAAGLDGIVITDHFFTGNSTIDEKLPWEEKAHLQFDGFRKAKEEGDKIGLDIFYGFEFPDKGSDFLVYGLGEEFIAMHPEIPSLDITEIFDLIHNSGGYIIHAHPLRISKRSEKGIHLYPKQVDAIEVYNGAQGIRGKLDKRGNTFAEYYAAQLDLPQTAGSDSHEADRLFGGAIVTDQKINSIKELIEVIKSKRFTLTTD